MATTPWDQLKAWFTAKIPDNNQEKITPKDLRDVLGEVMDSFEKMLYYLVTSPEPRAITITDKKARSWPVVLKGSSNTIGFMATTTVTKRTLVLDKTFKVTGAGVNRTLLITDPYFDDFATGDELVWVENVKGGEIKFQIPQFKIQEVNGGQQYGWEYPDDPDSFTAIGAVSEPNFSSGKPFPLALLNQDTILTHGLNSPSVDVRVKNAFGQDIAFVYGIAINANQVRFEMEAGASFANVTVFVYAFPNQ